MADLVDLFIEHGAYINIVDDARNTPLHVACRNNQGEVAVRLIELGALPVKNLLGENPGQLMTDDEAKGLYAQASYLMLDQIRYKQTLPALKESPFHWIANRPICMVLEVKNIQRYKNIFEKVKISCLSAENLRSIESMIHESLHIAISSFLKKSTAEARVYCTNVPLETVKIYSEIVNKVIRFLKKG